MGFFDRFFGRTKAPEPIPSAVIFPPPEKLGTFIEAWEGRSLTPYKDSAGLWTVGVGHLLRAHEELRPRSNAEIDALFGDDLSYARSTVATLIRNVSAKPQHADALVSFMFNLGAPALRDSTLLRKLNMGDIDGAAAEFGRWNHARDPRTGLLVTVDGLTNRRAAERAIFLLGDYSGRP